MKKIYLSFALIGSLFTASAQDAFWSTVSYQGAFPVTDGTPATNWANGWSNFDPENTIYPSTVTTVSTDVLTSTTWSGVILLQNKIYVKNNATLTILPGTIIRGDKFTQGTLIITRGAKINAAGTAANPIVFTSNEAIGTRNEGDWGGLVLLGLAKNNQPGGVANIEGIVPIVETQFGGNFDNDNSGVLQYVRVEFAGIPLEPNKELNGITFGSVGSATTVDHLQVSFSGDDSYEFFGGMVNCKYLIAYRGLDDDFDTDFGYRGKIQFGLSIRDKDMSDAPGDSNSFESDNDAAGSTAQPKTRPIFSNMTLVGPKGNGSIVLPVGEKFEKAFRLRRNTATSCFNSLVVGWEKGLSIEGTAVVANVNGDSLVFSNNSLTGFNNGTNVITSSGVSGAFYQSMWTVDGNDSTETIGQINWVNLFTNLGVTPDARLSAGSVASNGATFTNAKFFSIAAPGVANLTYCQNTIASALTATSVGGNTLYWYTTASGGIGSTVAPVPTTGTSGIFSYYVSQKNTAGDESPRVLITVTVNAAPNVSAGNAQSVCAGTSVTLSGSGASTYAWNNNIVNGVAFTPTATQTYTVTGTALNGCTNTDQVTVTVNALPTVNAGSAQTVCAGTAVTLSASGAASYAWSNGVTNATSFTPTATQTYTVTGTGLNGCTNTAQVVVTVNALPIMPIITASGPTSFCTGGTVNLTSSYTGGNLWSNGAISSTITVTNSGTYTVAYTNINGCSSISTPTTINVSNAPVPTINASGLSACTGDTIVITSSPASSYLWSNGATTSSINVTTTGNYSVTVTNANACNGVGQSTPIMVTINNAPVPTITASALEGCVGDTIMISSSSADSYMWSNGATTPSINVTASGTYSVTVMNANTCNGMGASMPMMITFNSNPVAGGSFTTNGNVVTFANTSTGANSYSWDFGDMSNSTATAPMHAYIANGAYTVTLTAYNGNCSTSTTLTVNISVGIDELTGIALNLFPNPAVQEVQILLTGAQFEFMVVTDQSGRIVGQSNETTFNVQSLATGVYQAMITTDKGIFTKRFVVSK